ncbi:hypothetical protein [uncultured Croceitalea sp.]|uniref:hypothetical protein n=1 Tax=uncultured Croceitalea sp. TaxID=1798908 RepID=UPI0033062EA6
MKDFNYMKTGSIKFSQSGAYIEKKGATKDHIFLNQLAKPLTVSRQKVKMLLAEVKEKSTILYWTALFILLIGAGCMIGLLVDDRMLMGVNVWIKPLKFSISIAIYLFTTGYLITKYPYSNRKKNIINHLTAWSLLFEFGIIVYQASRGVRSHYNGDSAFDALLFLLMGVFVGVNVLLMVVFIFDTIRLKLNTGKAMQWSILLGWTIVLFGSWVGGQMIAQVAHNVGVADGGTGLPLVNWSTKGGDLRIAHFFALHGIQIMPLFALWISKKWQLSNRNQIIAVTIFALMFASWIGYIFYQAKQGIPMIAL